MLKGITIHANAVFIPPLELINMSALVTQLILTSIRL
nr:MAG TPA: hypothetical protein [Caudoviricetes sp.]